MSVSSRWPSLNNRTRPPSATASAPSSSLDAAAAAGASAGSAAVGPGAGGQLQSAAAPHASRRPRRTPRQPGGRGAWLRGPSYGPSFAAAVAAADKTIETVHDEATPPTQALFSARSLDLEGLVCYRTLARKNKSNRSCGSALGSWQSSDWQPVHKSYSTAQEPAYAVICSRHRFVQITPAVQH